MPSLSENKREWDTDYDWSQDGDEWSQEWGGARAQWLGALLPRVFSFLDQDRILEIAPGHGRWTQFLKDHCKSLLAVDLSPECVAHCERRFEECAHAKFFVNDGLTFPMVEDNSVDFVFSFDSLVHAAPDVMASYVRELSRKLKPGGAGFIHHSNVGALRRSVFDRVRRRFTGIPFNAHWRDGSMTAELMRSFCAANGMSCVEQELVPWGKDWSVPIDCLSIFVNKSGITTDRFLNSRFIEEANRIRRVSALRPK